MGLRSHSSYLIAREYLVRREFLPKVCIFDAPRTGHKSLAVSSGFCLAAACLIPGSTAQRLAESVSALQRAISIPR